LVIKATPEIIKKIPDFRFKIIGGGSYRTDLEALTKELGVEKYCYFLGKIESDRELEEEIAKSCAAIAPYIKKLDTWTYYADPGKVKKYLAGGVPVLLTDLPWNAKEISEAGCGKIISEDIGEIAGAVVSLMSSDRNPGYRTRAQKYARSFNYINIFAGLNL
jgi:glycosyltransferase involved in cell wall biosynthesis